MANKNAIYQAPPFTYTANGDLSSKNGYIAQKDAAGTVSIASAATDDLHGIILDGGEDGQQTLVATLGSGLKVSAYAGGTINEGDAVTANASGECIATTTKGDVVIGHADTPGASGYRFDLILDGGDARYANVS